MKERMIYPSCSEMVFRLEGNVKEVKKEVLNMLDCIEADWKEGNYLDEEAKETLNRKRKEVKKVKKMKQFEDIVFPFTTNYETQFKECEGGIKVATCNNITWNNVEYSTDNADDYHKVVKQKYFEIICQGKDWIYLKIEFANKKEENKTFILSKSKDYMINDKYDNGNKVTIQLDKIKGGYRYSYHDGYIFLNPIKNKQKLEEINKQIMVVRL